MQNDHKFGYVGDGHFHNDNKFSNPQRTSTIQRTDGKVEGMQGRDVKQAICRCGRALRH